MKFYNKHHQYYSGIDLHARKMYVCVIKDKGEMKVHKDIKTDADELLSLLAPFLGDIIVGVECVFCWYWLADLCAKQTLHLLSATPCI